MKESCHTGLRSLLYLFLFCLLFSETCRLAITSGHHNSAIKPACSRTKICVRHKTYLRQRTSRVLTPPHGSNRRRKKEQNGMVFVRSAGCGGQRFRQEYSISLEAQTDHNGMLTPPHGSNRTRKKVQNGTPSRRCTRQKVFQRCKMVFVRSGGNGG